VYVCSVIWRRTRMRMRRTHVSFRELLKSTPATVGRFAASGILRTERNGCEKPCLFSGDSQINPCLSNTFPQRRTPEEQPHML
jgi:hypothetical protein